MNYAAHPHYAHLAAPALAPPVEQPSLFPAPEHTSRDPWPEDVVVPRAVALLQRKAEAAGCAVKLQYSRGHAMHARLGTPLQVCHFIGVRLRRADGVLAYAVYRRPVTERASWTWQDGSIRSTERPISSIAELTTWLDTPKNPSW